VVKEGYGQTETTLLLGTFKVRNKLDFLNIYIILENEQMGEARINRKSCPWV
jgi:hypothetical protein